METARQLIAALFVLALLGGVLYFLRRKGVATLRPAKLGRTASRQMKVIEQLRLSPQHSLHLVSIGDRVLLVASSPSACSVVRTSEICAQDSAVKS